MILSSPITIPSAKLLRDKIEELCGVRYIVTTDALKVRNKAFVRYGSMIPTSLVETQYNSINFINISCHKDLFSNILLEHHIFTPQYFLSEEPTEFPIMIRTTLNGHGGVGIHIIKTIEEFHNYPRYMYYWTKFYPIIKEYRVHVLGGKVAKIFKKERDVDLEPEEFPIRNNKNGYHFSLKEEVEGKYTQLEELVHKVAEILPGKFYALDIGWVKDLGYIVIESNSAPGLNENTAELYAKYLIEEGAINNAVCRTREDHPRVRYYYS